jgi:hypothetical protein
MTTFEPITTYRDLVAAIDRVRVATPGVELVYRGQTYHYDGLVIPSVLRPNSSAAARDEDEQWRRFVWWRTMSDALAYAKFKGYATSGDASQQSPGHGFLALLDAKLQHYGARSTFIDVTRSLDIALWFAHHRFNLTKLVFSGKYASGAENNPQVQFATNWAHYTDRSTEAEPKGYLFVFAIQEPVDKLTPAHGDFVDLAWMQTSARMLAQEAALIYASAKQGGRVEPAAAFVFDVPLRGAPRAVRRMSASKLFPAPDTDLQYHALLRTLPFVTNLYDLHTMSRPLPIPEYRNHRPRFARDWHWRPFRELDRALIPTFLFELLPGLDREGLLPLKCDFGDRVCSLGDAKGILSRVLSSELGTSSSDVAAPIRTPAELDSQALNMFLEYPVVQALIPELSKRYALAFMDEATHTLTLRSFAELRDIRGVWIVRHKDQWWCQLFGFADNQLEPHPGFIFAGPAPARLTVVSPRPGNKEADYLCRASLAALQHVLGIFRQMPERVQLRPTRGPLFDFYLDTTSHLAWRENWA